MRQRRVYSVVGPQMRLEGGDRLMFVGAGDAVKELRAVPGLRPAIDQVFKLDGADGQRCLAEVVLSRFAPAVGNTLVESAFRSRYNAAVIAISRNGQRLTGKLGELILQPGDTLLVETDQGFIARHGGSPDFLVVSEVDGKPAVDRRGAAVALGIIGLMVAANTLLGVDILISALTAAAVVLLARCVSLNELRRSFDLRLLLVIALSFALGAAVQQTGVAAVAAAQLSALAGTDPFWTLALVYGVSVLATELLSNNAAAVPMFPIALSAAHQLDLAPMPFVMAVMMGASAGFMTPIGYQTNLIISGPGGYRFGDYLRLGVPLSLVVGAAVLSVIPLIWPFQPA